MICTNLLELATFNLLDLLNEENNYDLNKLKDEALKVIFIELKRLTEENAELKTKLHIG